jgi:APA family basic amino acid/polyamine antiporter
MSAKMADLPTPRPARARKKFRGYMADQESTGLIRAMGRWTLAALIINSTIGSGIFGLPSIVAGYLGKQSPLAYLIAAAGMGIVVACFAELASQFREAGGPYLYAREAFGRTTAIEVGFFLCLIKLTGAAAAANLFTDYLAEFWPAAQQPLPRLAVLTLLIGFVAIVNVRGVKSGASANNVFTVAKMTPLVLFAISGCLFLLFRHSPIAVPAHGAAAVPARNWFEAILVVLFGYAGFEGAVVPMSEAKDPQRDAPFALFVALATVTVLYSSVQYVVVSLLPDSAATGRPLAAAAQQIWGTAGAVVISLCALVSVYGYLVAALLHSPRVFFALGEKGDIPGLFARIHPRYRTPHVSIFAFAGIAWFLAVAGSFKWNVLVSSVGRLVVYGFTCAALPVLRRASFPSQGYRLRAGNIIAALGVLFVTVLAARLSWGEQMIIALALMIPAADRLLVGKRTA